MSSDYIRMESENTHTTIQYTNDLVYHIFPPVTFYQYLITILGHFTDQVT